MNNSICSHIYWHNPFQDFFLDRCNSLITIFPKSLQQEIISKPGCNLFIDCVPSPGISINRPFLDPRPLTTSLHVLSSLSSVGYLVRTRLICRILLAVVISTSAWSQSLLVVYHNWWDRRRSPTLWSSSHLPSTLSSPGTRLHASHYYLRISKILLHNDRLQKYRNFPIRQLFVTSYVSGRSDEDRFYYLGIPKHWLKLRSLYTFVFTILSLRRTANTLWWMSSMLRFHLLLVRHAASP